MRKAATIALWLVLVLTAAALWWLGGTSVSKSNATVTIGIVNSSASLDGAVAGFKAAMADLGYREAENIRYLYAGAARGPQELDREARRSVEAGADLIFSIATPATQAAQTVTEGTRVPIVFGPVTDPVGAGIVNSLRAPGRNATGIRGGGATAKTLEWLLEICPNRRKILVFHDPGDKSSVSSLEELNEGARKLGAEIVVCADPDAEDIVSACGGIPGGTGALLILPSSRHAARAVEIVAAATARRLPVGSITPLCDAGVLLRYGEEPSRTGRQAARLADQVLRGTPASEIPVETADFALTINLQAAERIGLEVPDKVIARADRVLR